MGIVCTALPSLARVYHACMANKQYLAKAYRAESPTLQMRSIEKIISLRLFFS
jgi:hypothetical protein